MDITPQDSVLTQSMSDDQELSKALAGVLPDEPSTDSSALPSPSSLQFGGMSAEMSPPPAPSMPPTASPVAPSPPSSLPGTNPAGIDLDSIKADALNELRPLIGRVDLPPEEKFDTYLMLIRSTDDASLIQMAHAAAQNITEEKRKAEALLDIIKEIDYLSRKDQEPKA